MQSRSTEGNSVTDPDDNPFPHTTRNGGASYWLNYARQLLGPRRRDSQSRPSLRELVRRSTDEKERECDA